MKYQTLKSTLAIAMAFVVLSSNVIFPKPDDKTTDKARDAVENASPDDWYQAIRKNGKIAISPDLSGLIWVCFLRDTI